MKTDFIIDYVSCILFRLAGFFIRRIPRGVTLFFGRRLGDLLYYSNRKHSRQAYLNIKTAFGNKLSPRQLSKLTHEFFRAFGQSIIEIFIIPLVNKEYLEKYITFEGLDNIAQGFKKGKGVILLGVHAGSWELSNIICANLGFPFRLFVRDQGRYKRIENLLNRYRTQKGCKFIQRQNQTRQLIEALKNNQAIGMTVDQGGKGGVLVKFFGKSASMATGALRLALKYDSTILPSYYTRLPGARIKVIVGEPFELKKTGEREKDIQNNLQRLVSIFERYITANPKDYLWTYKIWKYGNQRDILILSDSRAGHLRQSEALAGIVSKHLAGKGARVYTETVELAFKNRFSRSALLLGSCLPGNFHCRHRLWPLKKFLHESSYSSLVGKRPDVIISCGQSLAPVNLILAKENSAKSLVVMRPSLLGTSRFDLVIVPRHDNPPRRKNIVVTEGALNLIDEEYLKGCIAHMAYRLAQEDDKPLAISDRQLVIGLLIGGDTKNFSLGEGLVSGVIKEVKSAARNLGADILLTTSRRTSAETENTLRREFKDYSPCKLLVIANQKNIPEAVGGVLGLSQIVIVSPESISMISEAINSAKFVLVFNSPGLDKKHRKFLEHLSRNKYIYLEEGCDLGRRIEGIWRDKPAIQALSDNLLVSEALKKVL